MTNIEAALDLYTFGMHGDLPALLDRHHTVVAVAPRPMTIREFEDMLSELLGDMEAGTERHIQGMIDRENEEAKREGREEIRDELSYWKGAAQEQIEHLRKALEGEGREGVPNYPVAVTAFRKLKDMIDRVQEL
jgi:hypothetical protein